MREKLNMKDACDTCLGERNRMFWTASQRRFILSPAVDTDSGALPPLLCSPLRSPCGTNPRRRPEEVSVPSHRSAPSSVIWFPCGCVRSGRPIKQQSHFQISILAAVSARRGFRSLSGREVAGTGRS